jgi:hypothetical protein
MGDQQIAGPLPTQDNKNAGRMWAYIHRHSKVHTRNMSVGAIGANQTSQILECV